MKLVVLCATLLLLTTGNCLEALCKCIFAELKQQLDGMLAPGLSDFEKISCVTKGLTEIRALLHGNKSNFFSRCSVSSCNANTLRDLIAINLQLQNSASRSVLQHLPRLSDAVREIESTFFRFENYIKALAGTPQTGSSDFKFEFWNEQTKLHTAMEIVCLAVDQRVSGTVRQQVKNVTFKQILQWTSCEPRLFLPICIKLHSAALQYILMVQTFASIDDASQSTLKNLAEGLDFYNNLSKELLDSLGQCRAKGIINVDNGQGQLKRNFLFTGVAGITIVMIILFLAAGLAIWMATKRRAATHTFGRVFAHSEGYEYETGFL